MELGAILVVQRSPAAVQPRRASALPRVRGVPLPTRSGRRGGVLRVPLYEALPVTRGKRYMLLSFLFGEGDLRSGSFPVV